MIHGLCSYVLKEAMEEEESDGEAFWLSEHLIKQDHKRHSHRRIHLRLHNEAEHVHT